MSSLLPHFELPKNLAGPEAASKLQEVADAFVAKNETIGSLELLQQLNTAGRSLSSEDKDRLRGVRSQLQFAALTGVTENELKEFLATSTIRFIPNQDLDLFSQIRVRVLGQDVTLADDHKKLMQRALDENKETLGSEQLTIANEAVPPTGSNWLKLYRAQAGTEDRSNITRSRFLFENEAAVNLSEQQRNVLADFLYLYDLLGVPTGAPGAIDTIDPHLVSVDPELEPKETFEEWQERLQNEEAKQKKRAQEGPAPTTTTEALAERPSAPPRRSSSLARPDLPPAVAPVPASAPAAPAVPQTAAPAPQQEQPAPKQKKRKKMDVGRASLPPSVKPAPAAPAPAAPKKPEPTQAPQQYAGLNGLEDIATLSLHGLRNAKGGPVKAIKEAAQSATRLVAEQPGGLAGAQEAWKQTELYRVYIEMGNESMSSSKNIAQVSEERKQLKKPTLTPEEFEAVAELSRVFTK